MRVAIIAPGSRGDVQPYITVVLEQQPPVSGQVYLLLLFLSSVISHFGGSA
jgi:hypothetical protein